MRSQIKTTKLTAQQERPFEDAVEESFGLFLKGDASLDQFMEDLDSRIESALDGLFEEAYDLGFREGQEQCEGTHEE